MGAKVGKAAGPTPAMGGENGEAGECGFKVETLGKAESGEGAFKRILFR